ncbi:MAG: carbon storage regulator [Burkholderiaceae bacterium]
MLVISRVRGESIHIDEDIVITIVDIRGDKIRIGIEAPSNVAIHRKEIFDAMKLAGEPIKSFAEVSK